MIQISVNLASRSYPIFIGSGIANDFSLYYKEAFNGRRCAFVTNDTVASIYQSYINDTVSAVSAADDACGHINRRVHIIPDGEKYKTVSTWSGILDGLVSFGLDRRSVVVAFGGGVVGDMAGFAAACFMRGIDYIQIPTTLLAMVDSGVGGKTAVDHTCGKNLIGAFHQPSAVWIDVDFLKTLPRREFIAGYGEAFKYAFIGSPKMFSFIGENKEAILRAEPAPLLESIERGIRIKAEIVGLDERESKGGRRALLNFGHTFAHALERFYGFEGLLHGEAVLLGMVCAVELAKVSGNLHRKYWDDFDAILDGLPKPALPAPTIDAHKIYDAMFTDKKTEAGNLRFVLPVSPGESAVVCAGDSSMVSKGAILDVLEKILKG